MFGDETGGIVVDYGAHATKYGFAGEDCPRLVLNTKYEFAEQYLLGMKELFPAPSSLPLSLDDVESKPETPSPSMFSNSLIDHPVMCIIPALFSTKEQISTVETILEGGSTPALYLLRSPVAAMFASGKTSALVVDMGASSARCSSVYQGYTLLKSTTLLDSLGGDSLALELSKANNCSLAMAEELKRHTSFDTSAAATHTTTVSYALPDGTPVEYDGEVLRGMIFPKLGDLVHTTLSKCDPDLRKMFAGEMLLVGGGSLYKGMGDRLMKDLSERINPYFKPKVHSTGTNIERHFAAFVGGSILACLGSFQQEWASKQEVLELGAERICLERFTH